MCRSRKAASRWWIQVDESLWNYVEVDRIHNLLRFEEIRILGRWLVRYAGETSRPVSYMLRSLGDIGEFLRLGVNQRLRGYLIASIFPLTSRTPFNSEHQFLYKGLAFGISRRRTQMGHIQNPGCHMMMSASTAALPYRLPQQPPAPCTRITAPNRYQQSTIEVGCAKRPRNSLHPV